MQTTPFYTTFIIILSTIAIEISSSSSSDDVIKINYPYTINERVLQRYSIEVNDELTFDNAKTKCDQSIHCAGVSEELFYDHDEEEENIEEESSPSRHIIFHSFMRDIVQHSIPPENGIVPELNDDDDDANTTAASSSDNNKNSISYYHSNKAFTVHKGQVIEGTTIKTINNNTNVTVDDAKKICIEETSCVAFTYPLYSSNINNLLVPDNITFVSAVDIFENHYQNDTTSPNDDNIWYTLLSNDISKAKYINVEDSLKFDDKLITTPYSTCCNSYDIPTMDDISNVDTLERISCNITKEQFHERYIVNRQPVVLVGCDKSWNAKSKWNFHDLSTRFNNDSIWRASIGYDDDIDENTPWSKIVDAIHNKTNFIIFDPLDLPHGKTLEDDYSIPYPIQGADLYKGLQQFPSKDYGSLRWFCVSNGNSGTDAHMDPISTDAWNTVLQGHKWWVIFPDTVNKTRHMKCDASCSVGGDSPHIRYWYASIGANVHRHVYPDTGTDQRPMHVLQSPGETIYVPYGRIHSVYNMDETIAITANFGSKGNFETVWVDIITSGPAHWKRAYYTLFNKYQRKLARNSNFWPPADYEDYDLIVADEEDEIEVFKTDDDDSADDDDDNNSVKDEKVDIQEE